MQLLYVRDDFDFPVFSSFFNPRGLVARINRFDSIVNFFNTWCFYRRPSDRDLRPRRYLNSITRVYELLR